MKDHVITEERMKRVERIECFHSSDEWACFSTKTKERKCLHENRVDIPEGLVGKDTNMAAVPLLGDISMAAVTSRENSL